jgi:hypothetical protein
MKKILLSVVFIGLAFFTKAQVMPMANLVEASFLPPAKFGKYVLKKGFTYIAEVKKADTALALYRFVKPVSRKTKNIDSTDRYFTITDNKDAFLLNYITSSAAEYYELKEQMKILGFYCNQEADSLKIPALLYQHNSVTVISSFFIKDSTSYYSLYLTRKKFPPSKDISYADDLMIFNSHEYISHYFGEKNVQKDIFFLPDNKTARCSVLFPNTALQVVFVWKDEINHRGIVNLLLGGQQKLQSSLENPGFVGESNWICRSGLRAGMTLYELRKLNDNNFKFYSGHTKKSGTIIPEKNGKLDFKKEDIVLSCINCEDAGSVKTAEITADDAIADGKIVFVLSVCLSANNSDLKTYRLP